jgi:hypothetical protein
MFSIGHQPKLGVGQVGGCQTGGCHTASSAVSGVYNSHKEPHGGVGGVIGGNLAYHGTILQPGLGKSQAVYKQPVLGHNPIGNYSINQSVATGKAEFAPVFSRPAVNQNYVVPTVVERGRPTIGGNGSVVDMGAFWQVCEDINMGLFTQKQCRTEPKFR